MISIQSLLEKLLDLSYGKENPVINGVHDHIQAYTCEVLPMRLMALEFNDAIREGDRYRISLLLVFSPPF